MFIFWSTFISEFHDPHGHDVQGMKGDLSCVIQVIQHAFSPLSEWQGAPKATHEPLNRFWTGIKV
jgi:hypothetical protein